MKSYLAALYGPDGLVTRMAVVNNQAISTLGGKDVMERALKHAKGQGGNLARQKAVAEAIARVPARSSAVLMVSLPAKVYALGEVIDPIFAGLLPPERRKAMAAVPMPKPSGRRFGTPAIASVQVEDRTITLQIDMPQSELGRTFTSARSMFAQLFVNGPTWA